jgi:hypothetical protein
MSIDLEYAIKKDIRNNPVLREIDTRERREIRRMIWLSLVVVGLVLFAAWQHFEIVRAGYATEDLRAQIAQEEVDNRKLRLSFELLRSPQALERRAVRELGMAAPLPGDTMIIERVPAAAPYGGGVVAQVR